MNNVIERALQKGSLPLVLEHPELDKGDGLRPDDLAAFPFSTVVEGVYLGITCVLIFLLGYSWMGQQWKLAQLKLRQGEQGQ